MGKDKIVLEKQIDEINKIWLGKWFLFQTFEELDGIKEKESEVQQIYNLLDGLHDSKEN